MKQQFSLSKSDIDEIFSKYLQRNSNEEILYLISKFTNTEKIASALGSSTSSGISQKEEDMKIRKECYGDNYKYREPIPPFIYFIWDAMQDTILIILLVCALVDILIGATISEDPKKDWLDGVAIFFACVIIVLVTSITNYQKEKKFKQLSEENYKRNFIIAIREGENVLINEEELLVGDICKIEVGNTIPADGIIIDSNNLKIDESTLTGESRLIEKLNLEFCQNLKDNYEGKRYPSPIVFSGTVISEGSAKMLVLATGSSSMAGKIREQVIQNKNDDEDNKTPLELKLEDLATLISYFGYAAAIVMCVGLLIRLIVSNYQIYHAVPKDEMLALMRTKPFWLQTFRDFFYIVVLSIALIIVAIPEGLPLAATLSLSFTVNKMMEENNLVRRMNACETMGGAKYILTDKTGTLTRNKMHVVSVYDNTKEINVDEIDHLNKTTSKKAFPNQENFYKLFKNSLIHNLHIELDSNEGIISERSSKTDYAFYDLFKGLNETFNDQSETIDRIEFDSNRKKMSTICKIQNEYFIFMKGAPDVIFESCSKFFNPEQNKEIDITQNELSIFTQQTEKFSSECLRNLAIAYKRISLEEIENYKVEKEEGVDRLNYSIEREGFVLISICAVSDALRPLVPQSVGLCQTAGIRVIMITGDDEQIAKSIARNANIIQPEHEKDCLALKGTNFYKEIGGIICIKCNLSTEECTCPKTLGQAKQMFGNSFSRSELEKKIKKERIGNISNFKKIIKNLRVIYRSRAIDKYALVLGLRQLDNVTAVTGDGTNDAPALSKADVGFAMGLTGTDIARDASDIIILDDNFNSIVSAIKWGRKIFDNVRKFIQFQISINISAVLVLIVSSFIGSEAPLSTIQMLWVNLIIDTLASLALATEKPHEDLLYRKPHKKRESILSPLIIKHLIFQSLVHFSLSLLLMLYGPHFIKEDNSKRVAIITELEKCFGSLPVEYKNGDVYHILNGRRELWDRNRNIIPGSDCMFLNNEEFAGQNIQNLFDAFKWYNREFGSSVHFTMVFNTFVLYAFFNQINCRKIDDSFNIFQRITSDWIFIVVVSCELVIQVVIVQFGGIFFKTNSYGLTLSQWGICIAFACISFVVSIIAKLIPMERLFINLIKKKEEEEEEEEKKVDNSMLDSTIVIKDNAEDNLIEDNLEEEDKQALLKGN